MNEVILNRSSIKNRKEKCVNGIWDATKQIGLFICFIFLLLTNNSFSQETNEIRLNKIPAEIDAAVKIQDYEKATRLKKERELREQLLVVLKSEDYEKAAQLKKEIEFLKGNTSGQIFALEKEMENAINNENYARAGEIKKQIESLKSGSSTNNYTQNSDNKLKTSSSYPIPEFINQVYLYKEGKLLTLEKAEGELKTSGGGFIVASATSSYVISGPKSNVRLNGGNHEFIVKVAQGLDPSEFIKLVKLDIRGKRSPSRYADQYKSTAAMYHSETSKSTDQYVNISFHSVNSEEGVFEISTPNLGSGEYAFMYISKMYAFGIE